MPPYLTFVHALSPLHAGTGQGVDVIDLPIAREKATNLPLLPGSSFKGPLRDACDAETANWLFGTTTAAGLVQFSDQRLLLLPIRSLAGTFAWVTSPYLLARCARDVQDCRPAFNLEVPTPAAPSPERRGTCVLTTGVRTLRVDIGGQQRVVLEDLDLEPDRNHDAGAWAAFLGACLFPETGPWRSMLRERLCIVHDQVLTFLMTTATEVVARVRLEDETKTVASGALWYEEALPTESILSGLMIIVPPGGNRMSQSPTQHSTPLTQIQTIVDRHTLQFGGKATVGRGLCHVRVLTQVPHQAREG